MTGWGSTKTTDKVVEKKEVEVEPKTKVSTLPADTFVTKRRKNYIYLLYGNSGSGKTFSSLTFPKPIIIIDTESRADIIKDEMFSTEDIKIFNPLVFPDEITEKGEMLDYNKTIKKLVNFLLNLLTEVKKGMKLKTIVFDSASDLWNLAMNWGAYKLSDKITREGKYKADPDTLKFNNQMDWQIPKNMHYKIFQILKNFTVHGINVVFTARQKSIPAFVKAAKKKEMGSLYAETFSDKISCQKELPFNSDIIIRSTLTSDNKRFSIIEKSFRKGTEDKIIENMSFEKIEEVMK